MKNESQNSDSVDYIYSGILNRYCATAEENVDANMQIGKNLLEADAKNEVELAKCDSSTDSLGKKSNDDKSGKKDATMMEVDSVADSSVTICAVDSSTSNTDSRDVNDEKENCDESSTVEFPVVKEERKNL